MNKEQIYDAEIAPLMTNIIEICRKHGIAMIASYAIPTPEDDNLQCTTSLPDENDTKPESYIAAYRAIMGGQSSVMQHADGSTNASV